MITPKPDGRGDGASGARPLPLVVGSRPTPIVAVALAGIAVVATMLVVRRSDLEFEDDVTAVVVLVIGFWLVTQALGLTVRRLVAGHAMRLDETGLHHPGWGVVPWSAMRAVSLRRVEAPLKRHRHELVLDLDPACAAPFAGSYVRWMFGPIEGLWRRGKPIRVPLVALAIAPDDLVAAIERGRRAASAGVRR